MDLILSNNTEIIKNLFNFYDKSIGNFVINGKNSKLTQNIINNIGEATTKLYINDGGNLESNIFDCSNDKSNCLFNFNSSYSINNKFYISNTV